MHDAELLVCAEVQDDLAAAINAYLAGWPAPAAASVSSNLQSTASGELLLPVEHLGT